MDHNATRASCVLVIWFLLSISGALGRQITEQIDDSKLEAFTKEHDLANRLWNDCQQNAMNTKGASRSSEFSDMNEIDAESILSSNAELHNVMSMLPPQMKHMFSDCLMRLYLPYSVSGKDEKSSNLKFFPGWCTERRILDDARRNTNGLSVPGSVHSPKPAPFSHQNHANAPSPSPSPASAPAPLSETPFQVRSERLHSSSPDQFVLVGTPSPSLPLSVQSDDQVTTRTIVVAVVLTAVCSFIVAALLFCCYLQRCDYGTSGNSNKDDKLLLDLNRSDPSIGPSTMLQVGENFATDLSHAGTDKEKGGSATYLPSLNPSKSKVADEVESSPAPENLHSLSLESDFVSVESENSTFTSPPVENSSSQVCPPTPLPPPTLSPPPSLPLGGKPGQGPPPPPPPPPSGKPPPPPPPLPAGGKPGAGIPPPPSAKSPPPPPLPVGGKPGAGLSPPPKGAFPPRAPPPKASMPPLRGSDVGASKSESKTEEMCESATPKAKLKPFFWDKAMANRSHSMVWDQIKSGSFQFNEEMIETLFGTSSSNKPKNYPKIESGRDSSIRHPQILDPKKSQNLSILLRALNVTIEEVSDSLLEGTELGVELIQTLLKMEPTAEEEYKLQAYTGDLAHLGPAERFLKTLVDIPFAFKRLDALLLMEILEEDVTNVKTSLITLEVASIELRSSRLFMKLLEAVLKTGNRMNDGTYRGGAQAFKLDTLLKLSDVKGTDGKTTLLHFVVQEIIRSEGVRAARESRGSMSISSLNSEESFDENVPETEDHFRSLGLHVVSGLGDELQNVKKAAAIDTDMLTSTTSALGTMLLKTKNFLNSEMQGVEESGRFRQTLTSFVEHAEDEIKTLLNEEKRIMTFVKSTIDYFHGNSAKDEGLRLFVIVRDFLTTLDKACKEAREAPIRVPQTPQAKDQAIHIPNLKDLLFPAILDRRVDSSDDDESPSP